MLLKCYRSQPRKAATRHRFSWFDRNEQPREDIAVPTRYANLSLGMRHVPDLDGDNEVGLAIELISKRDVPGLKSD